MTAQKRIRPWAMVVATLVVFVLVSASGVLGAKIKEFTADNVTLDSSGKVRSQGKIYMASDKMRAEHTMGRDGTKMILIYRRDKKELWALNPAKKVYVQMPLDEEKWELYNVDEDFSLVNNLASEYPEKLEEMKSLFMWQAQKYHVLLQFQLIHLAHSAPWPRKNHWPF